MGNIIEYNHPEFIAEGTGLQPEQPVVVVLRIFKKIKQMRTLTLGKLKTVFHRGANQQNQEEETKETTNAEASKSSRNQSLQQAELVEAIADPLIWLEYNLVQIITGIETLKKQISQSRKNTLEQINQLSVDQVIDLSILLGSEDLRGIHTTNLLHKHSSDLPIQ